MFKLPVPKFETQKSYARRAAVTRALRWGLGPAALAVLLIWVVGFRSPAAAHVKQKAAPADAPAAEPISQPAYAASALGPVDVQTLSPAARAAARRAADKDVA